MFYEGWIRHYDKPEMLRVDDDPSFKAEFADSANEIGIYVEGHPGRRGRSLDAWGRGAERLVAEAAPGADH